MLRIENDGPVMRVTLDRPEVRNAFNDELIAEMTTKNRDAVSSVSLDEEMADLMRFQRSYQANARVVRVIDEMLDGLINNMLR